MDSKIYGILRVDLWDGETLLNHCARLHIQDARKIAALLVDSFNRNFLINIISVDESNNLEDFDHRSPTSIVTAWRTINVTLWNGLDSQNQIANLFIDKIETIVEVMAQVLNEGYLVNMYALDRSYPEEAFDLRKESEP